MDVATLATNFINSPQGRDAASALADKGIDQGMIHRILQQAAHAGAHHVELAHQDFAKGGIMGEHAGLSFFAGFAAGLFKGDGIVGALEDGAAGIVVGRIAEALTAQVGIDSALADTAAATCAPHVMKYLKAHIGR
jgi:hypothetical protein